MARATFTSRDFNQDVGRAKRAAKSGPVIITDRGKPAFVLTTFNEHQRVDKKTFQSLLDALAMPEDDIELQLPPRDPHPAPVDLD